jgi:hypothetical protein
MHKSNVFSRRLIEHGRGVTAGLLVWLLCGYFGAMAFAATPVVLMPVPKPQFFDNAGRPLAFGCVFAYANGTTTPLATYTDYTGNTQNSQPVDLTAGGFTANGSNGIWLQAGLAYRLKVVAAGGSHCATGATQYTIDGIGGGTTTLTTNVTYSTTPVFNIQAQNQLFVITLTGNASSQPLTAVGIVPPGLVTWEIIQDNVGGHTFSWPANSVGGCTIGSTANQTTLQHFIWDGTNAIATGPCVIGNGPEIDTGTQHVTGDVNITGSAIAAFFKSVCATPIATTGTIRLCKTDKIFFRNAGDSGDQGIAPDTSDRGVWSFSGGLVLQGTNPSAFFGGTTASFPYAKRNGTAINFRLGDDSADAPITASTLGLSSTFDSTSSTYVEQGPEVATPSTPASGKGKSYFKTDLGQCSIDDNGVERCGVVGASSFGRIQHVRSTSACTTGSSGHDSCNDTLTWPTSFGDTNYSFACSCADSSIGSAGETAVFNVFSRTATQITVVTQTEHDTRTAHCQVISCIGIHD